MTTKDLPSILVGLTPSIDSVSVLILLKLQGHQVAAIHVGMLQDSVREFAGQTTKFCDSPQVDLMQKICQTLDVPFYIVDQKEQFADQVMDAVLMSTFMKEYFSPCLNCHFLKLTVIHDKMKKLNMQNFATGHFAKIGKSQQSKKVYLAPYADPKLDQHKLLAFVSQEVLSDLILPLGELGREDALKIIQAQLGPELSAALSSRTGDFCDFQPAPKELMKAKIPATLFRKNRLCLREKNANLSEYFDNAEFKFGTIVKYASGNQGNKDEDMYVSGYNYSFQTIYIDPVASKGMNYIFGQIVQHFYDSPTVMPMQVEVCFNEEDLLIPAIIYFKAMNYVVICMKNHHPYVPGKSLLYCYQESRQKRRLFFVIKAVAQSNKKTLNAQGEDTSVKDSYDF